jgi:hypothetical protein
MDRKSALVATVTLTLLSLTFVAQMASANPIPYLPIHVVSPENNKVYSSNQVELNFTVIGGFAGGNFASFSYSLDGQEPAYTNQSCVLVNLPPGDHTLIIYGNDTADTYWNGHQLLSIVYFSTIYPAALVSFVTALIAALAILSLLLFFRRKQIATRIKREKKVTFWIGLPCFLFFTTIVFVPSLWNWTNDYLFPRYPVEIHISPIFGIIFSIPFIVFGLMLMWFGTRKSKPLDTN